MAQEECRECSADLAGRADRAYCCNACRQAAYRRRRREAEFERRAWGALAYFASLPLDGSPPSRNAEASASRNKVVLQ